jgi:rubrerythrin
MHQTPRKTMLHRCCVPAVVAAVLVTVTAFAHRRAAAVAVEDVAAHAAEKDALTRALDDERRAIATYEAVLARFGERRPFSNIVQAERRHAAALRAQFDRLNIEPPPDRWKNQTIRVPDTFAEACDAAEVSEVLNAAMYDELIASVADETIIAVFRRLQEASQQRHLRAFRRHGNGWHAISGDKLSPTQQAQYARATDAKNQLLNTLITRLQKELEQSGPADAIEVCKQVASAAAKNIGKARHLRIGRTSWKLRNPENAGPPWTGYVLGDKPEAPRFASARDGTLGVTLPILTGTACLTCHGPAKQIDPTVRKQLREHYPQDQAVNFNEGELRGWFWIEVPPAE